MGIAYLDLQIENPAVADTSESVRALIDTGAIYSANAVSRPIQTDRLLL